MGLAELKIQDFRNITHAEIQLSNHLNILYGRNGSGKTSVLEAIHYLGVGRSFRTTKSQQLINHGQQQFFVHALIRTADRNVTVGIKKAKEDLEIKRNGAHVSSISEIAIDLPILVINPEIHQIIEGSPKNRRRFLDWGVFHVEHDYAKIWKGYNHVLRQRNSALRQRWKKDAVVTFDDQLIELSEKISTARESYMNHLQQTLAELLQEYFPEFDISLEYKRGWSSAKSLQEVLRDGWTSDQQNGFTSSGPHKADIRILIKDTPARDVVSRGQQKIIASLMRLAQIIVLQGRGRQVTLLVDDMAAELDVEYRARLLHRFLSTNSQILLTTTELDLLPVDIKMEDAAVFHVERGEIKKSMKVL